MRDGVWEAMTPAQQQACLRGERRVADDVEQTMVEARRVLKRAGGVRDAQAVLDGLPAEPTSEVVARRRILEEEYR